MTPDYRLEANQRDITRIIRDKLVSLDLRDSAGFESDTLTVTLADDGVIQWPNKGATLDFWLGLKVDLTYKGRFVVDELDWSGPPDQIVLHAKAVDMLRMAKTRRNKDWSGVSIGSMIEVMAAEQGLIPAVSERFAGITHKSLYQLDESDLHFLTRLARNMDAIAKAKGGRLIFIEQGLGRTAKGSDMPLITLDRSQCSDYSYQERGKNEYDRVGASYYYYKTYTWGRRTYQGRRVARIFVGQRGRTKYLRERFDSEDAARRAAQAALNQMGRSASTLSLTLNHGMPALMAEMRLQVTGLRRRVSELDWIISDVSHSLSGSGGLSSSLSAVRPAEFEVRS